MTPINRASAGRDSVEAAVEAQLTHAAEVSENLGELRNHVRKDVVALEDPLHPADNSPVTEHVRGLTVEQLGEMKEVMEGKAEEIEVATEGHEKVGLSDDLGDGVNGQTGLEQPEKAVVAEDLVLDPTELKRTVIHESDKEVGHASHVAPDVPNPDVAIIRDGARHNVTTMFEGYVERGTSIKMGEGPQGKRPGQPEETYAEGQELANDLIDDVGEETFMVALQETGDYGEIQKKLWEDRLEVSQNIEDVLRVYDEAQETGYHEEAAEVINPALQRIMVKNPAEVQFAMAV